MAMEQPSMPINGTHASQGYDYTNTTSSATQFGGQANNSAAPSSNATSTTAPATTTDNNGNIPKDEVGWYFVEQYYTTLSRNPHKLFLFYQKKSQFVYGDEAEKVSVCVGQRAIDERIRELDIQDCKVRVTNVDAQSSGTNIVIQVIGEISNRAAPHRKFVQTFVLAPQDNGFYVLNDIFRYIVDEEEQLETENDEVQQPVVPQESGFQETASVADEPETKTLTSSADPAAVEHDARQVDHELEAKLATDEPPAVPEMQTATVNGEVVPEGSAVAEDAPAAALPAEDAPAAALPAEEEAVSAAVEEQETQAESKPEPEPEQEPEVVQPEVPKSPKPSPLASPPKPMAIQPTQPTMPAVPAVPKTWASMVASGALAGKKPVTPAVPPPSPAPAQPKAASSKAPSAVPTTPAASVPREPSPQTTPQSDGWQTAVNDHGRRQNRPQSLSTAAPQGAQGYIKTLPPSTTTDMIKSELSKYGNVIYCDIHFERNCAFVNFDDPAGLQAAITANPHAVGENGQVLIEERRTVNSANFRGGRGGMRGSMRGGRGDGRVDGPGRGGFPREGGRGGFIPRGRGGAGPRGRGAPQAA